MTHFSVDNFRYYFFGGFKFVLVFKISITIISIEPYSFAQGQKKISSQEKSIYAIFPPLTEINTVLSQYFTPECDSVEITLVV